MKFLIVDDMAVMRQIIKKMLRQAGYTDIHEADDGVTAWPLYEEAIKEDEPFDFIISDWNMPQMTGIEFLKKVREHDKNSNVFFLMVTAESDQQNVMTAVSAGVSNYIVKPFSQNTLQDKIISILEKGE